MNTLVETYESHCREGRMRYDKAQAAVLTHLDELTKRILTEEKKRLRFSAFLRKKKLVTGVYLHGPVGAGKSYMMDAFFNALPIQRKQRIHFHAFMKNMHDALKKHEGKANPLKQIVKAMAENTTVLCFDEFVVNDIADAMVLRRVFTALFEEGVCVVVTSNTEPDQLYWKGLQRINFLPTIALLKKHLQVIACHSAQDYRLRHLKNAGTYHTPLNQQSASRLEESFQLMSDGCAESPNHIILAERIVPIIKASGDCIWFDFSVLCHPPRSQRDYLELTEKYKTLFLSHIPMIQAHQHNTIMLFIRLIDVLYDAKCAFICSAEAAPMALYTEGRYLADYQRTCSRLQEMQSEAYVLHQT